uniref:uncharacterized protein LOC122598356 isoform X1 n=1 Tax=Erigeron canadensis TaxID=72917 RepID=UPI001CB8914C|nr:uncharacterized protein LOC122598356 isoform X1 [Erigeron canadensis]
MAASFTSSFLCIILLLVTLTHGIDVKKINNNNNNIISEEGYTVTTIIDGDKLNINPYSVFPLYGSSSSSDIVILDYVKSTIYTVSFSGSQVSDVKKLSGNGDAGYKDGELASAMFNKPKSFAIDRKNNIYIADKTNHVIRKISKSGVTTIAGGNVQKTGKADGPAQNASFSDDFELAFDPQRCALLISDHGNRLVRQLDLKAEDCAYSSSGSVLGSTIVWGIGVGVACIIGLIVGFVIRPYVLPHEAPGHHRVNMTWKHCLISLGKQAVTFYFVIRSAIASHNIYHFFEKLLRLSFSQLSLVFGINMLSRPPPTPVKPVSLLDCDDIQPSTPVKPLSFLDYNDLGHTETIKTHHELVDELKDLITYDGTSSTELSLDQENAFRVEDKNEVLPEMAGKLDRHIYANFAGFVEGSKRTSSVESWVIGS